MDEKVFVVVYMTLDCKALLYMFNSEKEADNFIYDEYTKYIDKCKDNEKASCSYRNKNSARVYFTNGNFVEWNICTLKN